MELAGKKTEIVVLKDVEDEYRVFSFTESDVWLGSQPEMLRRIPDPILRLPAPKYPPGMSFRTHSNFIFMVGGVLDGKKVRETHICNLADGILRKGPPLVGGKNRPILFTIGSKLYAVSSVFPSPDSSKCVSADAPPHFEMLDLRNMDGVMKGNIRWQQIPFAPNFPRNTGSNFWVFANTVVGSCLLISVDKVGVFGYDTNAVGEARKWRLVSRVGLPFNGESSSVILPDSTECWFGRTPNTRVLCAYRLSIQRGVLVVATLAEYNHRPSIDAPLVPLQLPSRLYGVDASCVPLGFDAAGNLRLFVAESGIDQPCLSMADNDTTPILLYLVLSSLALGPPDEEAIANKRQKTTSMVRSNIMVAVNQRSNIVEKKLSIVDFSIRSYIDCPMPQPRGNLVAVFTLKNGL